MLRVGIAGATGYTGLELCRLLQSHASVSIERLFARSHVGKTVSEVFPHAGGLSHVLNMVYSNFEPEHTDGLDVLFLALPHGTSHAFMSTLLKNDALKVIDLSADFRLNDVDVFNDTYGVSHASSSLLDRFIYGLPEFYREQLTKTRLCASPECYPTSVILGLKPLVDAGLVESAIVDAKSGASGAGRGVSLLTHFCEVDESVSSYNTGVHRHHVEMVQECGKPVFFSPHLIPMKRGILSTIYINTLRRVAHDDIRDIFQRVYQRCPFIKLRHDLRRPSTNLVSGSNNCMLTANVFDNGSRVVVVSMIDNLIKGAAGQAVQAMNIMCGFDETDGLCGIAGYV